MLHAVAKLAAAYEIPAQLSLEAPMGCGFGVCVGCAVAVNLYRKTPPWGRNDATDGLYAIWRQAGAELGFTVLPEERGGLSDGNHFWQRIPTLDGLGPSGGNAHCSERSEDGSKDQEYVLVSSFVPKATLNTMALLHLIGAFDESA